MSALLAAVVLAAALTSAGGERVREIRLAMGTFAEIQVAGAESPERALASAFERIDSVERSLSVWHEHSEVSRLNREGEVLASGDLLLALERCLEISVASNGAFDVTREPGGFRRVRIERAARRVRLEGVKVDLGSIAKGLAVDAAIEALAHAGAKAALVDLGTSSIAVFGDEPASFEIRNPDGGPPPASFLLSRGAVGSSSRDQAGPHVVDPRSGDPATSLLAVTVVAGSALEADALSTAAFVLGAKEGLALLEARGASGVVLFEDDGCLVVSTTPGFSERYRLELAEGVRSR